jgi:hypothetical protein
MNKITSIIVKYLNSGNIPIVHPTLNVVLSPGQYRGNCPFQNEKILEDINFIKDFLEFVKDNDNCLELKQGSLSLIESCQLFDVTPNELKKNIMVTLSRLGLIFAKTGNWDYVCVSDNAIKHMNDDIESFEEFVRSCVRSLVNGDKNTKDSIDRIKSLIGIWGGTIYWWEIWFCLRTDVDFDLVKKDVREIRKMFGFSKTKHIPSKINEVTNLFDEHNITKRIYPNLELTKKITTLDFVNLRAMISNSWGNRFAFFNLKPQGKGGSFTLDNLFNRESKKVKRLLKKDTSYLTEVLTENLDNHHIVPHDYGQYLPEYHDLIENKNNGILISKIDHNKFPKKNNDYVILEIIEENVFFKSIKNPKNYIVLEKIDHLNLEKIKETHIPFNRKLVNKIFG